MNEELEKAFVEEILSGMPVMTTRNNKTWRKLAIMNARNILRSMNDIESDCVMISEDSEFELDTIEKLELEVIINNIVPSNTALVGKIGVEGFYKIETVTEWSPF